MSSLHETNSLFPNSTINVPAKTPFLAKKTRIGARGVRLLNSRQGIKVRPFWHYLALGIPIFMETLSMIFEEMMQREKIGEKVRFRFRYKDSPAMQHDQIQRFHRYNELAYSILNNSEYEKALEIGYQTISAIKKAEDDGQEEQQKIYENKYESLLQLLKKHTERKSTRKNISSEDWATLDMIDYELSKKCFSGLADVFNSGWFKNLNFCQKMMQSFGVDYQEAVVAENLAMSVAYIEGLDGKSLCLPCLDPKTGIVRSSLYEMKEFYLGDELPCYILESNVKDAPVWFIARGTQYYKERTGSFESILADAIDSKCIARNVLNKTLVHRPIVKQGDIFLQKQSLNDIFQRWREEKKNVILAGHSLGGTLVNNIAVELLELSDSLKAAYGFSAAGVSKQTSLRYQQLPANSREKIINFDFEGDPIPAGGHSLIGRHFAVKAISEIERAYGFYETHVRSHFNRDFQLQAVDISKENNKFSRLLCEKIRVCIGRCLRFLLRICGKKYLPDWWSNRKIYRERAEQQRSFFRELYQIS